MQPWNFGQNGKQDAKYRVKIRKIIMGRMFKMGKNENNNDSLNFKDFVIGAFFGGIVGGATALLFAPKTGKEIRQNIGEQSITLKERGTTIAQKAKERSTDFAKTVSDQSSNVVSRVKEWQIVPKTKETPDEDTIEAETLRERSTSEAIDDQETKEDNNL